MFARSIRDRFDSAANLAAAAGNGARTIADVLGTHLGRLKRQAERDDRIAPPTWLLAREAGYLASEVRGRLALRRLAQAHRKESDHRPILLVPGFLADNRSMFVLYATLRMAGYRARHWGLGRNRGACPDTLERLESKTLAMAERFGQPVTLIGWSLGGVFAREIAHRHPEAVREVITLGSPISGDRRANNLWWLYERYCGHPVDAPPVDVAAASKPPVLTTAFWSRWDGIIAPASARGEQDERDEAVELQCSHMGYVSDPAALDGLLSHLAGGRQSRRRRRRSAMRQPAAAKMAVS